MHAEEIVLSVPDGRRVTTLINATPICSADREIEFVVITMQDLRRWRIASGCGLNSWAW